MLDASREWLVKNERKLGLRATTSFSSNSIAVRSFCAQSPATPCLCSNTPRLAMAFVGGAGFDCRTIKASME